MVILARVVRSLNGRIVLHYYKFRYMYLMNEYD